MEQEQHAPGGEPVSIVRGADDQLAALERLWAQGELDDLQADEVAWQTLRRAMNASRRAVGARLPFPGE